MHHDGDAVALERLHALWSFIANEDLHPVAVRDASVFPDHFDVLRVSGGRRSHGEHHCNHKPAHGYFLPGSSAASSAKSLDALVRYVGPLLRRGLRGADFASGSPARVVASVEHSRCPHDTDRLRHKPRAPTPHGSATRRFTAPHWPQGVRIGAPFYLPRFIVYQFLTQWTGRGLCKPSTQDLPTSMSPGKGPDAAPWRRGLFCATSASALRV